MYGCFEMPEIKVSDYDGHAYLGEGMYQPLPNSHLDLRDLVHQRLQDLNLYQVPCSKKSRPSCIGD